MPRYPSGVVHDLIKCPTMVTKFIISAATIPHSHRLMNSSLDYSNISILTIRVQGNIETNKQILSIFTLDICGIDKFKFFIQIRFESSKYELEWNDFQKSNGVQTFQCKNVKIERQDCSINFS